MFPLGNVLVPHALLPLHVFEPRYRAMVADLRAGDGEFGVVLIEQGSEVGGGDARSDLGTLARILQAEEFDDGRWGVVAVGVRRLRVRRWLPDDPYPLAEVDELPDPDAGPGADALVDDVRQRLRRVLALAAELGDPVAPATSEIAADPVVASYHATALAPIGPYDTQRLLGLDAPDDRLKALLDTLAEVEEDVLLRLELERE